MKHLHFDAFAGLSGDMILAALIDAGSDTDALRHGLATLPLDEPWELRSEKITLNGFAATDIRVLVCGADAENLPAELMPDAKYSHQHADAETHTHHHHQNVLPHRNLADCLRVIEGSDLSERVRHDAARVFNALAIAEAKIHNSTPDRIHFHEVGATDAIIDIVGACLALELLGVESLSCSPLPMGRGFVRAAHGIIPVPAPATLELLRGRPVISVDVEGEMVTPTGAALVATLCDSFGGHPHMTLNQVGYGAGKRRWHDRPNLLRVFLGDTESLANRTKSMMVIETNLDDANPQIFEHVSARLFASGARDVWLSAVQMKKNRPGVLLSCLADAADTDCLAAIIFDETPTLGLRLTPCTRMTLEREWETLDTRFGRIRIKWALRDGVRQRATPEYEDCRRAAERTGAALQVVMQEAAAMITTTLQYEKPTRQEESTK